MVLLTTLTVHRTDREAALWSLWKGPVDYEPYHFFSVFSLGKWHRSMTSTLFLLPFCAVNLYSIAWTTAMQLGLRRCTGSSCEPPPALVTVSSFAGFLGLVQVHPPPAFSFLLPQTHGNPVSHGLPDPPPPPHMDSECASGCTWSTAQATARLRDSRPWSSQTGQVIQGLR